MSVAPVAQQLTADLPFAVARRALAEAREALGMDVAWLSQRIGDQLVLRALVGDGAAFGLSENGGYPLEQALCARVVAGDRPCWFPDALADPATAATAGPVRAYVGVPVHRADGELYGTLCCAAHQAVPDLDERDAALLRSLAGVVASQLEHEHRYHRVLETASEPVWVTDLDGVVVFVNEPTAHLLGVDRAAFAGRSAFDFVAPEEHARVVSQLAERATGRMNRYETVLLHADGSPVPVEVEGAPLSDARGEVIGTVATVTDLTARKQAERLSEERFRWLAELVDHHVWISDPTGAVVFVNERARDQLGPEVRCDQTRDWLTAFHPDDRAEAVATAKRAGAAGEPFEFVGRLRHADGTYREHHTRAWPGRDRRGRPERWYGVSTDLTELRAQERLLHSEASLREAQAIAGLGSFERDLPDGALRISEQLLRMLGLTQSEFGGVSEFLAARVHPDDAERLREEAEAALRACGTFDLEHRVLPPGGGARVVHLRGAFHPGADGKAVRVTGTVQDVTERREAEMAADEAAEARRESRAKSEFLSRMSHELRTPLNAILGFGQLLELDSLSPDQRDSVGHILKGGAHLLDLINEVLELSRIEAGALRLSLEAVELGEAVRDVVALVSPLAVERGVALRVDPDPGADGTTWVRADIGRMKQIVLNLLSNAIKYNRAGGLVTVRIRPASAGGVRLVVSDTGPGLAPDELERAFRPFERLSADGTTEGTGLGLTLSRSLAEAMAGTLDAASEPGCGADFTLVLAAAPAPEVQALTDPGPAPAQDAALDGRRVLCVEDNPSNLRLVERVLSRAGVEVLGAPQGRLGLELARRHVPDLVLLDLDLPDVSGEAVLATLTADPATAGIPVVVCSADASTAAIERLRAGGAEDYLTKPLDVARLLKTVARMTDGEPG